MWLPLHYTTRNIWSQDLKSKVLDHDPESTFPLHSDGTEQEYELWKLFG